MHDFFEAALWNDHPLGLPILGTQARVKRFTRKPLVNFFRTRYGGGNVVLTAAGNLKHDEMLRTARNAFGALRNGDTDDKKGAPVMLPNVAVLEKDLEQVHLVVGAPAPSAVSPQRYAGLLMNAVLGGSMSSRLFQEIRENRGLAYEIHSFLIPYSDTGMLGVYVATGREKVREVVRLIMRELKRMANDLLSAKELRAVKELTKGNLLLGMESMDSRMTRLARNEICFGKHIATEKVVEQIDAVSANDIRSLAAELFDPAAISLAAMGNVSEEDLTRS